MRNSSKVRLTLACGDYDINLGLLNGSVKPEGVDLIPLALPSPERHWRMIRSQEFDVCELSLGSYLMLRDQALLPLIAIPVFPHRRFRHSYIFVNGDAGIRVPKDLEGRRVGIRTWQTTAGVWTRGILEEYYSVDLSRIHWLRQDEEDIPSVSPPAFDIVQLPHDQNLSDMLAAGDIDGLIYPETPSCFKRGAPTVRRLFADPKAEEQQFYRDTGLFPLMHTVVIREAVLEAYPWIGTALVKAFQTSKELALQRLQDPRRISLAWIQSLLEEQVALMGKDPWSYDFCTNRVGLETLIRYAHGQGLIRSLLRPEDLFYPPALHVMPLGYV